MINQDLPKLAIVGYGSMGKEIERMAIQQDFEITDIFDINKKLDKNVEYNFDVAIDFTQPDAVLENISTLASLKKNIVIGTTGWLNKKEEIENIVMQSGIGLVYGSNFSIGMQLYFKIIEFASKLLNKTEGYDIMLSEMHHRRKKDSPSGTALTLADIILREVESKKSLQTESVHRMITPEELHVTSIRGGEITGTHTVFMDSEADTLEFIHRAKNRSGFAAGALVSATWVNDKKGMFEFSEVMSSIWS